MEVKLDKNVEGGGRKFKYLWPSVTFLCSILRFFSGRISWDLRTSLHRGKFWHPGPAAREKTGAAARDMRMTARVGGGCGQPSAIFASSPFVRGSWESDTAGGGCETKYRKAQKRLEIHSRRETLCVSGADWQLGPRRLRQCRSISRPCSVACMTPREQLRIVKYRCRVRFSAG